MNRHTLLLIGSLFLTTCYVTAQVPGTLYTELAQEIDLLVAADGSGDYTTVQAAINAAPNNASSPTLLFIKKGVYREKVLIPSSKTHLTLVGEDVDSTVIVYDDYAGRVVDGIELNTFTSQTIRIDPDDFRAMNITFENDARPSGTGDGQNVAVSSYGKRNVFFHCRFISWQDTYYTGSDDRHYLKDCFIEGAVDYIFGHTTTIFDSCQIHTVRSKGYITAASTKENYKFGYVFSNCRLTAPPDINSVYLGRPWKTYAQTVFFTCVENDNIHPQGWKTWNGNENTCYYAEYNCTGPGSDIGDRVDWSHQLSHQQAENYTREQIFSAASSPTFTQDWDPNIESDPICIAVKAHTVMYLDSIHMNTSLDTLYVNGEPLPNWDPSVHVYAIELPVGTTEMPVISVATKNPAASVSIEYPESLPGFGRVLIVANDQASYSNYDIYFSVDQSFTNARLDSILILGNSIDNFDPDQFDYEIQVPPGTSKYFALSAYAQVAEAEVNITKPAGLPGDVTIQVTAADRFTSHIYTLHISLATGLGNLKKGIPGIQLRNSNQDGIILQVSIDRPSVMYIKIFDVSGALVDQYVLDELQAGENRILLNSNVAKGLYLYQARIGKHISAGKLLKL